ncbi:SAM dependent carboxyl methyltransferase [Dillenia turbinata]|uniref:SAM dependent carboxyl methyltransferase n=1 Tax=Dillenia turbinata TaxID=194707 RepID=A0AAN8ZU69_9MAGN
MAHKGHNVVGSNMKLENMFSMKGGKGERSYANNSQAQAQHARSVLHHLEETLDRVQLDSPEIPFVVVDLGCSSGNNTISIVNVIIKHMIKRYEALGFEPPEFSAFFSDLPSNDFNTLFQLLPPLANYGGRMEDCLTADDHRSYFAAGVPGSFYGRLFPARSIDVFYSAFSLHWLSQVPENVMDKSSTAYNRGRVFIHGANESIANAYKRQFQTDLEGFLKARSREMKRGGSMFLVCLGRTSLDPSDQGGAGLLFGNHFQDAWADLVHEVIISCSVFLCWLEVFRGGSPLVVDQPDDPAKVGKALATTCRTVSGVLVDAHIGERLSEDLFARIERRGASHSKELLEKLQFFHIVASLSLA